VIRLHQGLSLEHLESEGDQEPEADALPDHDAEVAWGEVADRLPPQSVAPLDET